MYEKRRRKRIRETEYARKRYEIRAYFPGSRTRIRRRYTKRTAVEFGMNTSGHGMFTLEPSNGGAKVRRPASIAVVDRMTDEIIWFWAACWE